MRVSKGLSAAALGFLVLGTTVLAACADNTQSLFIAGVVPGTRADNGSCTYTSQSGQGGSVTLGAGIFDVGLTSSYTVAVEFRSGLPSRADDLNLKAETSNIIVKQVIARVIEAGTLVSESSTPTYGLVGPKGSGIVPGIGIDSVAAARYRELPAGESRQLLIEIEGRGETTGGNDVESNAISLPVLVCNGCLVDFPPGSDDPATEGVDCNGTPEVEFTGCPIGQDQRVPCTFCRGLAICDPAQRR